MILVLLFVGVVIFVAGFIILDKSWQRWLIGGIGLIFLFSSLIMMIGNDKEHWGMTRHVTKSTERIASVSNQKSFSLLLYEPIRKSKYEQVYIYKHPGENRLMHTQPKLSVTNHVIYQLSKQATLSISTKEWRLKRTGVWHFLFAGVTDEKQEISVTNAFCLPKNWHVLSRDQANWLSQHAKNKEREATIKGKAEISDAVQQERMKDPTMTPKQISDLELQAKKQFKEKTITQEPKVVAKLINQAKRQPVVSE